MGIHTGALFRGLRALGKLIVKDAIAVGGFVLSGVEKELLKNKNLMDEVRNEAYYILGNEEELIRRFKINTGQRKYAWGIILKENGIDPMKYK